MEYVLPRESIYCMFSIHVESCVLLKTSIRGCKHQNEVKLNQ